MFTVEIPGLMSILRDKIKIYKSSFWYEIGYHTDNLRSKHVCEILNISPSKLSYWIRTKRLIQPDIIGKGRGKTHYFCYPNFYKIGLIQKLEECGFTLDKIKEMTMDVTFSPEGNLIKEGKVINEIYFHYGDD